MDQLRRRSQVLGVVDEIAQETRDDVLGGQIARAVLRSASEAIQEDPGFLCSLLKVADDFQFAREGEEEEEKSIVAEIEK